jgi:thiol-disulfide isomerase/thioredoxin
MVASAAAAREPPATGTVPPDFDSRNAVTHERVHLGEQHGKVVVLTFWATWCGPCRRELPVLERLQQLAGARLVVYAVPFQEPEQTYGELVNLARSWRIMLVDDRHESIASKYAIRAIPHLFIIGRDGRIFAQHAGYGEGSLEELVGEVNAALAVAPPAAPPGPAPSPAPQ